MTSAILTLGRESSRACLESIHLDQQLAEHPLANSCAALLPGTLFAAIGCQAVQLIKEDYCWRSRPRSACQQYTHMHCVPSHA